MFRMKSLTSCVAVALLVSLVSFAQAQTATAPATTPAKGVASSSSKMASTAKGTKAAAMTTTAAAETKKAATDTKKAATETKKEVAAKATDMAKYDLNTATKDDLMKVPGIGDATAAKIVSGRPWKMKSDLVKKGVMNAALYKKASPYMIAKTSAK